MNFIKKHQIHIYIYKTDEKLKKISDFEEREGNRETKIKEVKDICVHNLVFIYSKICECILGKN